ncbi:MAG: heavy-metal-associated domain-containing protein [Planctomycetes bacterium]|nr:heavy-metal-associated domain-containing protein [Planctomycetota bacterium]
MQKNSKEIRLTITGMRCASCVGRIEEALLEVAGVEEAHVDLTTAQATIKGSATGEALEDAIRALGYGT